jgi:hypothetical protein
MISFFNSLLLENILNKQLEIIIVAEKEQEKETEELIIVKEVIIHQ